MTAFRFAHRLDRRRFAAGLAAASMAPTVIRAQGGTPFRMVLSASPIPGADDRFRALVEEWSIANGAIPIELNLNLVEDVPRQVDIMLQTGDTFDIVELQDIQPFRYPTALNDISDIVTDVERRVGSFSPWATSTVRTSVGWFSMPIGAQLPGITYRPSLLAAAGLEPSTLATWDGVLAAVAAIHAATGLPGAVPLAQSPIAPNGFAYAWMWTHGAAELRDGSREVSFDSEELRSALDTLQQALGSDAFDARSKTLQDSSIHTAFVAGELALAVTGASPYLVAQANGDPDVALAPMPAGPAGTFVALGSRSLGIPLRAQNTELARAFLTWLMELERFTSWVVAHRGAMIPPLPDLLQLPMFSGDRNIVAIAAGTLAGRTRGWSAAPSRASAEVAGNHFVLNTFADVAHGVPVAEATARGQALMERFYTQQRR